MKSLRKVCAKLLSIVLAVTMSLGMFGGLGGIAAAAENNWKVSFEATNMYAPTYKVGTYTNGQFSGHIPSNYSQTLTLDSGLLVPGQVNTFSITIGNTAGDYNINSAPKMQNYNDFELWNFVMTLPDDETVVPTQVVLCRAVDKDTPAAQNHTETQEVYSADTHYLMGDGTTGDDLTKAYRIDITFDLTGTQYGVSPTVTSVSVTPATSAVQKGNTQSFSATVTGENSPAQDVIWSVSGAAKSGTAISDSGVLVVASDETASTLTVTATSTVDASQSGTATVTVTNPPPTVTGDGHSSVSFEATTMFAPTYQPGTYINDRFNGYLQSNGSQTLTLDSGLLVPGQVNTFSITAGTIGGDYDINTAPGYRNYSDFDIWNFVMTLPNGETVVPTQVVLYRAVDKNTPAAQNHTETQEVYSADTHYLMGDGTTGDDLTKAYRIDITFDLTYTNWDGSYLSALIRNISLQIGADQTQRNIVWYSDSSSAGKVQLALKSAMPGSDFPSQYQEFEATSESTVVSGLNSNKSIITGLAANTEYVYRVGNDDGWSDAYGFKTQNFSGSFSFLAAGDPQMGYTAISNDLAGWTNTLQKSHANFPDAGFILSLGDNINHLGNESEYEAFFGPETLKSLTLATVYGNHDAGINFSQHFNPPNVSDYGITPDSGSASGDYWYIYNNTLFMSLNSMNMSTAEHQQFMIEAIAQNPSVKWKIVVMHFPLFSAVTLNGSHDDLRAALAPIFSSLGIDVVLSGHDHAYTRTYMIGGPSDPTGQIPNIPEEGVPSEITAPLKGEVLYVSLNSSSGSLCIPVTNDVLPFVAVKNQESVPNISRINITDNSFTITTYRTTDMNVVDTFTINKTSSSSTIKDVSLNIGADQTQRLITWYSDSATAGELQLAPASAMTASDFPATYQSFPATRADSEATGFGTNKATITGLTANTAYVYRVGNSDGWSPVYHFSTESFNDADFSFLFAGDPQIGSSGNAGNDTAGWTNTLNKAAQWFSGASFLISAGDQVESYNNEAEYDGFFAPDTLRSLTLAPNIGNHDSDGINYKQHFSVPNAAINSGDTNAGGDYWYSYNNVLFMSLNSNNLSTAQHQAFLTSAIAAYKAQSGGNDPVWKIVTFHHSIYSTAGHAVESDILQRRNELSPVFKNLGVDAVLMGHDHVYTRSYMMDGTTPIFDGYTAATGNQYAAYSKAADSGATFYLTANSASGSKFYAIQNLNFPFMAAQNQENTPNITKVDVAEDALTFTTYRTGASNTVNDVVDTFTLSKQAAQTVDKSELNNLIIEAETEAEADYTAESWAAFAAALNAARTLSLDGAATQGQVDAAVTALRSAMDSLIPVQAPADKVLASISTSATSVDTDPEYTVSLRGMDRVSTVKLTFTADGNLLEFKNLETLNGFTALSGVTWKDLDNNLWQGEVTLVYAPGTQTTLTSTAQVDVAKIIHYAKGLGDAAMTLTGISVTGLVTGSNGDEMKYINSGIEPGKGSAVTSIGESYSVYDLNRDGKVDQIDLAVVVLYCQIDSNDPRWSTLVIVYDTKGEAITAALCDVNADGAVDMLDLLDLYLNYTA